MLIILEKYQDCSRTFHLLNNLAVFFKDAAFLNDKIVVKNTRKPKQDKSYPIRIVLILKYTLRE